MNILLVDDTLGYRLYLSELLHHLGHKCITAKNGKDAIDKLKENDIDLIIMDIEMPILNGIDAMKEIRINLNPPKNTTKTIALSAHHESFFNETLQNIGFNDFLAKNASEIEIELKLKKYT